MEIYWQNKDKNQVDVLVERTMKALIANNQSCAVIYDCDDSQVNNPASMSRLSGNRKPQIHF